MGKKHETHKMHKKFAPKIVARVFALLLLLAGVFPTAGWGAGHAIAVFEPGDSETAFKMAQGSTGVREEFVFERISRATGRKWAYMTSTSRTDEELVAAIKSSADGVDAQMIRERWAFREPNDPFYQNGQLWGIERVKAPGAWDVRTDSSSAYVAVLDMGIDTTHPDLAANVATQYNYNAFTGGSAVDPGDHATHVAGVIAAVGNNNTGVVGINWKASLISMQILDSHTGRGSTLEEALAIERVLELKQQGVNIVAVNMSLGGYQSEADYLQSIEHAAIYALREAGILVLAAAGNEGFDLNSNIRADEVEKRTGVSLGYPAATLVKSYPACDTLDNVIAVAASNKQDGIASFHSYSSNYGSKYVSIAAPGVDILSTISTMHGYLSYQGTSMATPFVSGAAVLAASQFPNESYLVRRKRILEAASQPAGLGGKVEQSRLLNVAAALAAPSPTPDPDPDPDPDPQPVSSGSGGCNATGANLFAFSMALVAAYRKCKK